ncbi:hypothetical protein [Kinneretia aquatilis]|uniref:hypothetical protein n=1 Tax=Kinneretia aquatilis TaxID=2070761 RepID=UPI0014952CA5|nr:hypothetical protein [Paucibacter aquatile]WIV97214.1 hypothetical protein K9V56_019690 [Paucibacter aquatile]
MRSPSALARCFFSWFAWMAALLKMTRCPPSPFLPPAAMAEPASLAETGHDPHENVGQRHRD